MHHRPRTVPELLDASVQLLRADFATFATLAAVAVLPLVVGSGMMKVLAASTSSTRTASHAEPPDDVPLLAARIAAALVGWSWLLVTSGAIAVAADGLFRGAPVSAGAALRAALRRGPTVLGVSVLRLVGVGAALLATAWCAFMIGAIVGAFQGVLGTVAGVMIGVAGLVGTCYLMLRWYVVTPVAALERVPYAGALDRSTTLTSGAIGRASLMLLASHGLLLATLVTASVLGMTANAVGATGLDRIVGAAWMMLIPIGTLFETMLYLDQRIRTEGLDLEMLERQLGDAAPVRARDVPAGMPGQVGTDSPAEPPARRGLFS